ncbi:ABC transporter ATP-binding protein [Brevibacillus ginsengisoli]|uniref:ABC transporter ATP-binding protein n=1 Tax=Brevibacillus ginsengisoli TaxID=363854 RepID=UPI003CF98098
MKEVAVRLVGVKKQFGEQQIVKGLDVDIYQGEFLTLLGPSGCGKTTTLRMIAGFEHPTSGEILLDGKNVANLPPNKRDINTVFQNYALFPHMTLKENIGYGLKMKGVSKSEINERVQDALRIVQMEAYASRKPRELSGGQQQRIAVARAIVNNPKVLLLDEPLGALDLKLRKQMQLELKHLQQRLGITFIYVTHDQEEALTMSDRVAVMNNGFIEQIAPPTEIYNRPQTRFVADFIGETNLLKGTIKSSRESGSQVEIEGILFHIPQEIKEEGNNKEIVLSIRPELISVGKTMAEGKAGLQGRVSELVFVGAAYKMIVKLSRGSEVVVVQSAASSSVFQPGEDVFLSWESNQAVVLTS